MTYRDDILRCECGTEIAIRRFAGALRLGHVANPPTIHAPRLAPRAGQDKTVLPPPSKVTGVASSPAQLRAPASPGGSGTR
jgi:hypothetical protein